MNISFNIRSLTAYLMMTAALIGCSKDEETPYKDKGYMYFGGEATFAQMKPTPAVPSTGKAIFFGRYDNNSQVFNYSVKWERMTSLVPRADLYFPSNNVQNGLAQRNIFNATPPRPETDSATGYFWSNRPLSTTELADLKAGKVYFQLNTQNNTGGEIRGYITLTEDRTNP
jgi:hypothetical protein